jgi:UDP-2,3-diacylglucosamine pyrophosphatase LpxH
LTSEASDPRCAFSRHTGLSSGSAPTAVVWHASHAVDMASFQTTGFSRWMSLLIGLVCLACVSSCTQGRQEAHFYFVQLTDTHFEDEENMERTRKAVELINDLPMPIKCVVHTGDITTGRIEDKELMDYGLSILHELTVPIHYVAGNHDILPEKLESTCAAYMERFGGLVSRAEYNDVVFIMVYTEPLRQSFTVEGYQPLKQLEEHLRKAKGKPAIVFHHAPSVDDFYNNEFHRRWKEEIRQNWVRLLNAYDVEAVIAGHFHRDEHHWLGDVPLYVSSPISGKWGRQGTFRIYEYRDGKIGYRTQYIE